MPYILGGDDDSDDDSGEDIMIFPITDIDDNDNYGADDEGCGGRSAWGEKRSEPVKVPSFLSLRQRRYSQLGFGNGPLLKLDIKKTVPETNDRICQITDCMSPGRKNWLLAFHKIRSLKDPWETFNIADLPKERAIRHRYNALRKQWKVDEITVKMEQEPFNHGAMRSCFRVKKLSSFSRSRDWKHALNYVGKKYMEAVDRDVYFEDVRLQMDAKLWGEEYNRHNPPKKVDIFQMCVIEFPDRPSSPLYHLEHFIEGNYIKYNSNSGFVEESLRLTPQTFSHFTFERSGHQLIVVDIQGVGDLWTDPQIHTSEGSDYGDGNLGPRGMALFFHSHVCNDVCESLQLTKFDLAPSELATQQQYIKTLKRVSTVVRGFEEMVVCASPQDRVDLTSFLARHRSRGSSSCSYSDEAWGDGSPRERTNSSMSEDDYFPTGSPMEISPTRPRRVRFLSESDDSASATMTESADNDEESEKYDNFNLEEDRIQFQKAASRGARPSCVAHEINLRNLEKFRRQEDSVLGQIHHEMAKYHECGRFTKDGSSDIDDMEAAMFHEQMAADLGIKEAILTMSHIYLDLPHDVLSNVTIQLSEDNVIQGVDYMIMAADVGDRSAMIYMAQSFENGRGLGNNRSKSYREAIRWYKAAVEMTQQDESGEFDATMDNPLYQLQAKMAELYLEGGFGLEKDPSSAGDLYNEAADNAMAAMKGRLANKYYALAEEAWGQMEEEPEE